MKGVQCQLMIGRGHIRASKGTFQFFVLDGSIANWHLSQILHFGLHFKSNLKGSYMGWEVKNPFRAQSKYGLMASSAKKQEQKRHKSAFWDRTPSHLHIKSSLYVCRWVQGSQIFKQNWIISFRSRVIVILPIWVSLALGAGAGGWGVSGVNNYSLYGFSSVQR